MEVNLGKDQYFHLSRRSCSSLRSKTSPLYDSMLSGLLHQIVIRLITYLCIMSFKEIEDECKTRYEEHLRGSRCYIRNGDQALFTRRET